MLHQAFPWQRCHNSDAAPLTTEITMSSSKDALRAHEKICHDFFTCYDVQESKPVEDGSPVKQESDVDDSNTMDLIVQDEDPGENKKTRLTELNYFNDEFNALTMITETIVDTNGEYKRAEELFLKQSDDSIGDFENRRHFRDEGHCVEEPPPSAMNHSFLKTLGKDVNSIWYCALKERTEKDIYNTYDINNERRMEILTKNVPPVMLEYNQNNDEKRMPTIETENDIYTLDFSFKSIRFNFHPLFSLEHILENLLIKAYKAYNDDNAHKTLRKLEDGIEGLRREKANFKKSENGLKALKNDNFKSCTNKLKTYRQTRMKMQRDKKANEDTLISIWNCIEYVRKTTGYSNTSVELEIKEQSDNNAHSFMDNIIELEVRDTIDDLKSEYYEKRLTYTEQLTAYRTDQIGSKPKKPELNYDEERLRIDIRKSMEGINHQSHGREYTLIMGNSLENITKNPINADETKRRNDVDKTRIFVKLFINDKEVCRSNAATMAQNFTVDINETFQVRMTEMPHRIKVSIVEKHTLTETMVCNVIIPVPKTSKKTFHFKEHAFKSLAKKVVYNHEGVGAGLTLGEIASKKNLDLKLTKDQYQDQALFTEGVLQAVVDFTDNSSTEKSRSNNERKSLSANAIENIMERDDNLDPNDPQYSTFLSYFNEDEEPFDDEIASNGGRFFFFNSDLALNFDSYNTQQRRSGENSIRSRNSETDAIIIPNSVGRHSTNAITNTIDVQRQKSFNYLQSIYSYFSQDKHKSVERKISDILIDVKYPNFRTIALDILHPKKPLFYQSRKGSLAPRLSVATQKDYMLKICIFKAFHLPSRQDNEPHSMKNENENGIIKMATLRPFVLVNCQGQTKRTTTSVGNSPTWNEEIIFSVRNNAATSISLHLYDETVENWLTDDRLEESTIHYHYDMHWLGSLKIPVSSIFTQSKMEGIFLLHTPYELLGYKSCSEEKHPNSHVVSFDGIRKDAASRQKDDAYLSVHIELFPKHNADDDHHDAPSIDIDDEKHESSEIDSVLNHVLNFTNNYATQFPDRKLRPLVTDCRGKNLCITRFFQSVAPFDVGEWLRGLFGDGNRQESSISSKTSTPHAKKERDEGDSSDRVAHERRRQSRSTTRDAFEMKSFIAEDQETPLAVKMQICTKYVSLIPLYKCHSNRRFVVLSAYQTLKLGYGSMIDHTVLLMGHLAHLDVECWCIAGDGIPHGFSTYVLIREEPSTNQVTMRRHSAARAKRKTLLLAVKSDYKYYVYDATTGVKYDVKSPFCPLQRVYFVCNNENIWANVQSEDKCSLIRFDVSNSGDWRPVFQKGGAIACPKHLDASSSDLQANVYSHRDENVKQLIEILEERLKSKVEKWRNHRKTTWNRYCGKVLKDSIQQWEKWSLSPSFPKPKYSTQMQQLMMSYKIYGFPLNLPYTTIGDIVSAVKGTQLHTNERPGVEFGLGVHAFPYPDSAYSVWVYFVSMIKKIP